MNTQKKPLDDPRVRRAIDYAINKEAYDAIVFQKSRHQRGATRSREHLLAEERQAVSVRRRKAKALLAEAGCANGMTLNLWISNFQDRVNGATVIQSMLAQAGIKVNIQVFESGVFDTKVKANDRT